MKREITMTVKITTLVDIESDENWQDTCDYLLDEFVTTKYPLDKFRDNCVYFSSNIDGKHYFKEKNK